MKRTKEQLKSENEDLKSRLAEAEQTLDAIRSGGVDAVVVYTENGDRIFTLQGAEHPYRIMVETMNEGAVTLDSSGIILYANRLFAVQVQAPLSDVMGANFLQFIVPREYTLFKKFLVNTLSARSGRHEFTILTHNKTSLPVLFSSTYINIEHRRDICILVTDLTDRKKAEQELLRLNSELELRVKKRTVDLERRSKELQIVNKELESFSYSISHDLRAPLRIISGFATVLEEDYASCFDEMGNEILRKIRKNTVQMSKLIEDLLSFSRLGRQKILPVEIDMRRLVLEIRDQLAPIFSQKKYDISIGNLPHVFADLALIRQVLVNLISNAIKFGKTEQLNHIVIGAQERENENIYFVKDTGIGFDMRYMHKMFLIFQRLHTISQIEGTGVGLAIVKKLVEVHGGKIWAEGEPGKGATFYFSLPKAA